MNILSANEIKRHGVTAIEEQLKNGPVHILKHNQPIFVALTEEDYQALTCKETVNLSGLFTMLSKPATGRKSKRVIDQQMKQARDDWR